MLADHIKQIRDQIAEMKEFIEPFESGRESLSERTGGGPWRDVTKEVIERERRAIANLEAVVNALTKQGSAR